MTYDRAPRLVNWCLYGYVASLPFEIPERSIPIEVHTLTGSILIAAALLHPRECFRRPPAAFWCFAVYFQVYFCLGVLTEHPDEWLKDSAIFVQVLLLFWIVTSLSRRAAVARATLIALASSCVALAVLQRMGVTASVAEVGTVAQRVTALGQNPNTFAHNMALGLVATLGLLFGPTPPPKALRPLAVAAVALLGLTIMPTAARGALLALMAGIPAVVLRGGTLGARVRNAAALVLVIGGLIFAAYRVDSMRNRFLAAADEVDLAQREQLFPAAVEMFTQRPFFGWGPVNNRYELERHVPRIELPYREAHNLLLELLTETGLAGAIPFLLGLVLCVRAAWKGRTGALGMIPFALMTCVLVGVAATSGIYTKMYWFVFALAAAPAANRVPLLIRRAVQPSRVLRVRTA